MFFWGGFSARTVCQCVWLSVRVTLTAVCGSVWLSGRLMEVGVGVEVEGVRWPSLPARGRGHGQGGGSSVGLSTHERMLCKVRTTAHTSHKQACMEQGSYQANSPVHSSVYS